MKAVERIGVSLDAELLGAFDELIASHAYPSRSEAIRDLIRREIGRHRIADPKANAAATLSLVYDHHTKGLTEKLLTLQHNHLLEIISTMHVHMDHRRCLEIIVLKGRTGDIQQFGERMIGLKGIELGYIQLIPQ